MRILSIAMSRMIELVNNSMTRAIGALAASLCVFCTAGCGPSGPPAPTSQIITFAAITSQPAVSTLALTATASSGLPVSFASTTASICTVSSSTATLLAPGTCSIEASQAGNSTYAAATSVTQSFTVNLASQTITFAAIATQTAGASFALTATASSGLPVSYTSADTVVCTVSSSTAMLNAAGTCTIQASQAGNSTYAAAAAVTQSFTVNAGLTACATPAASNPAVGSGTYRQITIDPAVYGTGSTYGWTVFGFSQEANLDGPGDPQVFQMLPNVVPRAWAKWDTNGTHASDYNFGYPAQAEADGIVFIGGTTATVLFPDEFPSPAQFNSIVSCNAQGQPVGRTGPQTYYRGSIASTAYRNYIIAIAELQIDGGANGVFFDEVGGTYDGATYNNNEGFDDANVADFGGFLCAKYPNLTAVQWQSQFGVTVADNLNCSAAAAQAGRTFNYRGYLARNGWDTDPLTTANPLAAEWGTIDTGHPLPQNGTFTNTYLSLVYWQDIVVTLRNYARQKYAKEIYITSNGVFPFVDFQSNGLYDGNTNGPGGTSQEYCPLTAAGNLDGTQSLMAAFLNIKQASAAVAGPNVLVSAFIDWPTGPMTNYLSLPASQQQDYWRMYLPEAYAVGIRLNMHLLDTIGDPTATQQGLMPFFDQTTAFYQLPAHSALYENAQNLSGTVTVSVPHVSWNLTGLSDGRTVAHLINHNYAAGFQTQSGVVVSFPVVSAPSTVTLVSPDASGDTSTPFTYANGQVQVTVPQLVAYVALVAK
jgi:hypothetical protein